MIMTETSVFDLRIKVTDFFYQIVKTDCLSNNQTFYPPKGICTPQFIPSLPPEGPINSQSAKISFQNLSHPVKLRQGLGHCVSDINSLN